MSGRGDDAASGGGAAAAVENQSPRISQADLTINGPILCSHTHIFIGIALTTKLTLAAVNNKNDKKGKKSLFSGLSQWRLKNKNNIISLKSTLLSFPRSCIRQGLVSTEDTVEKEIFSGKKIC